MINAEIRPPAILPLPPVEEIPPNTAIAMASISNPLPVVVFAPNESRIFVYSDYGNWYYGNFTFLFKKYYDSKDN